MSDHCPYSIASLRPLSPPGGSRNLSNQEVCCRNSSWSPCLSTRVSSLSSLTSSRISFRSRRKSSGIGPGLRNRTGRIATANWQQATELAVIFIESAYIYLRRLRDDFLLSALQALR